MTDTDRDGSPSSHIQFDGQAQLLDLIDELRSNGVSRHIELPQLVVCGDQSSGKSSVLEAISRVRFPSKENLCTRFATELILRRAPKISFSISIRPGPARDAKDCERLQKFQPPSALSGIENFAEVIEEAKKCMGLANDGHFCEDVLTVEIAGPEQPHLTLVDLPGIIHTENKHQSQSDINLVSTLVEKYMSNPRSIILAVVSAKNDSANQIVLQRARHQDKDGVRTLGIITKPDELRAGSGDEKAYLTLARNDSFHLGLGWHVLKNRSFESKHSSSEQRDQDETRFFQESVWASFDPSKLGITHLRTRLGKVLMQQIAQELPNLIQDIEDNIKECNETLRRMGDPRDSPGEQRVHLTSIGQKMSLIVNAAVSGTYAHAFFRSASPDESNVKNLRAVIEKLKSQFEVKMVEHGHVYDIWNENTHQAHGDRVTFRARIAQHVENVRGSELPGQPSAAIVGDVFRMQAEPWQGIAKAYISEAWNAVQTFLDHVLSYVASGITRSAIMSNIIMDVMREKAQGLDAKLVEIMKPYNRQSPRVCSGRFLSVLGNVQSRHLASRLQKKIGKVSIDSNARDVAPNEIVSAVMSLVETIGKDPDDDNDDETTSIIEDYMKAYYKISLDTFIDNAANLVVENVLLDNLDTIFCPEKVARMSTQELHALASETEDVQMERVRVQNKLLTMQESLRICRRYQSPRFAPGPLAPKSPVIPLTARETNEKTPDSSTNVRRSGVSASATFDAPPPLKFVSQLLTPPATPQGARKSLH